jgi:hypothetical protein
MLHAGTHPLFPPSHLPHFLAQMQAGRLFFLEVNQRMTRPIPKTALVSGSLRLDAARKHGRTFFCFLAFDFADRSCFGTLTVAAELPSNALP